MKRFWTAAEDEIIRREYGAGAHRGDVARKLGRSCDAVTSRARVLGLPPRRKVYRVYANSRRTRQRIPFDVLYPNRHGNFCSANALERLCEMFGAA